jgi:hypothetical protein
MAQTIRKKPTSTKAVEDFIDQAGSNLAEGEVAKKTKAKKSQVPLVIPAPLLQELDEHIEGTGVGLSRSAWICQVIREKLNQQNSV